MSKRSDPLMGLKCFSIGGRLVQQRQRCLGMTDEERRWRAQWLKDQVLSPEEPRYVPEYYKETTNFFRRLWKTPFNAFEKSLEPVVGHNAAFIIRHAVGKGLMTAGFIYLAVYFFKYHTNDFSVYRSLEITSSSAMFPDEPNYPNLYEKRPRDYYDQGFYSSVLCQDVEIPEPPPPPPPPPSELEEGIVCPPPQEEE